MVVFWCILHSFVHMATADNITAHWTDINHPMANNKPNAILHVTQNWNPGDSSGMHNNHEIGVYYKRSMAGGQSSNRTWRL
jgi:hypothetical protein